MASSSTAESNPSASVAATTSIALPFDHHEEELLEDYVDLDEEDDDFEDADDLDDEDYRGENDSKSPSNVQVSSPAPKSAESSNPNTKLLSQLLSVNLKLFQDNFRLKKFCSNFKLYLEKYCETSGETSTPKQVSLEAADEIHAKYEQNYGNIQLQLFNDNVGIKSVIDKLSYKDSCIVDYPQSSNSPAILEQILFSQTQSFLVRLEHDPSFEESLLNSLLEEIQAPESSPSSSKPLHNLRRRSSASKNSTGTKLYTCNFCTATFSFVPSLTQHLVREHESIFQCFACNRKFKSKTLFSAHFRKRNCFVRTSDSEIAKETPQKASKKLPKKVKDSSSGDPFTCPHCSITFKRASYMNNHIKGVHREKLESKDTKDSSKDLDDLDDLDDPTTSEQYYCCLCKQSFDRSIYLVDHIKAFHTENVCVSCNKQFKVRSCLNRHIKESSCGTQSPQRSYPCTFCNFPFKRITHLNQHILRKHSSDPSLQLVFENYKEEDGERKGRDDEEDEEMVTDDVLLLKADDDLDDLKSPISCTPCNLTFTGQLSKFLSHLQSKHITAEGAYLCVICSKAFKCRSTIVRHVKESPCFNLDTRPFRCRTCAKRFKRNNHLNQHMVRVHDATESDLNIEDDDDDDEDDDQDFDFEDMDDDIDLNNVEAILADNLPDEVAISEKEINCKWPGCGFVAETGKTMSEHRKVAHLGWNASTSTYSCTHCPRTFTDSTECVKHLRHDHHAARYRCNFNNGSCTFETTNLRLLREHKTSKHVKIKCYTCDWANCGKTFVNRSLVAHHIRIVHKNERLHPCVWPGCEQSFKRPINLRHHMATHTGVCNYRCPIEGCEQSFRNPGSLYLHRRRHEQQKAAAAAALLEPIKTDVPEVIQASQVRQAQVPVSPDPNLNHSCLFPGCTRKFFNAIHSKHHQELDHNPGTPQPPSQVYQPPRQRQTQQIIQLHSMLGTSSSALPGALNSTIMTATSAQVNPQFVQHQTQLFNPVSPAESTISNASFHSAPGQIGLPMAPSPVPNVSQQQQPFHQCHFANCTSRFADNDQLRAHINAIHLTFMGDEESTHSAVERPSPAGGQVQPY